MSPVEAWSVAGPTAPLKVEGPAALAPLFPLLLPGWHLEPGGNGAADLTLGQGAAGFDLRGAILPEGHMACGEFLQAADTLANALLTCYAAQSPDLFQVHASAIAMKGRVFAFLGESLAGKSTLALHLAAQGERLFGDDRLLLRLPQESDGPATALGAGLGPRVRLPLPAGSGAVLQDFVEDRRREDHDGAAFLSMAPGEIARLGEGAPLGAMVLLARGESEAVRLDDARPAEILQAVLTRSVAPHIAPENLVKRLDLLLRRVPCYHLRYPDSRSAAAFVRASLGES